jgi:predicted Fe-S protein YdhL (DUF1289 family)
MAWASNRREDAAAARRQRFHLRVPRAPHRLARRPRAQIDLDTNLCRGCLRNLDEIAGWLDYTIEEKLAVLARLEQRRSDVKLKP